MSLLKTVRTDSKEVYMIEQQVKGRRGWRGWGEKGGQSWGLGLILFVGKGKSLEVCFLL